MHKKPSTPPPQHSNQRRTIRSSSVQAQRIALARRRRQKKQWLRFAILAVALLLFILLVFGVVSLVRFFVASPAEETVPSASMPISVSAAAPASSSIVVSSTPAIVIPPVTGEFDVAGIPPLYNRFNPIPEEATASLVLAPAGSLQMETTAAAAFNEMQAAAAADGITLYPVSGYRTNGEQSTNYNNSIQRYLSAGHSQEEATRLTEQYYAIPGTSEHEAGLAIDIGQIDDSFAQTDAYAWLQENCTQYGFIYRYEADTVDITHINWEPWHYRFIGVNHALEYERLGMHTLEEYVAYLESA